MTHGDSLVRFVLIRVILDRSGVWLGAPFRRISRVILAQVAANGRFSDS
jgi:hypothetical protein